MFAQTYKDIKNKEKTENSSIVGWVGDFTATSLQNAKIIEHNIEQVTLSKLTYDLATRQLAASSRAQEEVVVTKVAVAITMGLPAITPEQTHHAIFAKQLYMAGEISFAHFINKMRNLFPDRMDNLSKELLEQIHTCGAEVTVN